MSSQATLELALQEAQYKEQQLELTNTNLQRQLERISEEKEECEREAVSCFNTLEVKIIIFSSLGCVYHAYIALVIHAKETNVFSFFFALESPRGQPRSPDSTGSAVATGTRSQQQGKFFIWRGRCYIAICLRSVFECI